METSKPQRIGKFKCQAPSFGVLTGRRDGEMFEVRCWVFIVLQEPLRSKILLNLTNYRQRDRQSHDTWVFVQRIPAGLFIESATARLSDLPREFSPKPTARYHGFAVIETFNWGIFGNANAAHLELLDEWVVSVLLEKWTPNLQIVTKSCRRHHPNDLSQTCLRIQYIDH